MKHMDDRSRTGANREAVLVAACRTLLATTPGVVKSLSLSVSGGECEGKASDWSEMAKSVAERYELMVEVSKPRDHLFIRFSRYVD